MVNEVIVLPIVETGLLSLATFLVFLYGAAQRHLRKSVRTEVEKNRTKIANAEALHEERLAYLKGEISVCESVLKGAQDQKASSLKELGELEALKTSLRMYLATEDGRAAVRAAQKELAEVQEEIRNLKQERDELRTLKFGTVVATVPYEDGMLAVPSFHALLPECERVWKKAPGTVLKVTSSAGTWVGTTSSSFIKYAESYTLRHWKGRGTCILSVGK